MKRNKAKADARTAIYRVLFGKQEHTYLMRGHRPAKRSNLPELDTTRQLSTFWEWAGAIEVWKEFKGLADFAPERLKVLEDRLEALRHYKQA